MIAAIVLILAVAAVVFLAGAWYLHRVWVSPARASLRQYETTAHFGGETYEVLFTPYRPAIFVHDPVRENYSLVLNKEGFGLKVSFPTSLYSRHRPLFFPWENVESIDRILLTNLLLLVEGRPEPFYLYAGVKPALRMLEEWQRQKNQ